MNPFPQQLYRGWSAPEAQANFNAVGGVDKAGYQDWAANQPQVPQNNFFGNLSNTVGNAANWAGQQVQNLGNTARSTGFSLLAPFEHPSTSGAVSTPGFVEGTPDWVKPYIQKASADNNIPTMMLSALLKQESGFNPNAVSPVGAQGIAQFMPGTAKGMGINPYDPEQSINGAAKYLRTSWDKFGKPELALAAYNAGGGAVNQYGGIPPYKETQNYVKNIMSMAGEPHQSYYGGQQDQLAQMQERSQKNSGMGR